MFGFAEKEVINIYKDDLDKRAYVRQISDYSFRWDKSHAYDNFDKQYVLYYIARKNKRTNTIIGKQKVVKARK